MWIRSVFLLLVCFNVIPVQAQDSTSAKRRKAIFIEGGGPVILPSVNFDTRFRGSGGWGMTGGVGLWPDDGGTQYSFAVNLNYLFGRREHFTEIGAGAGYGSSHISILDENVEDNFLYAQFNIGYRMQPARGFFLRLGANIMVSSGTNYLIPYLGVGLSR